MYAAGLEPVSLEARKRQLWFTDQGTGLSTLVDAIVGRDEPGQRLGELIQMCSSGGKPVQRNSAGRCRMSLAMRMEAGRPGAYRMTVSAALQ